MRTINAQNSSATATVVATIVCMCVWNVSIGATFQLSTTITHQLQQQSAIGNSKRRQSVRHSFLQSAQSAGRQTSAAAATIDRLPCQLQLECATEWLIDRLCGSLGLWAVG